MKNILIIICFAFAGSNAAAQDQFISKAKIEFEVKCNIQAHMGNSVWMQNMKDKFPKFSVNYFDYIFADDKSIFKFNRTGNSQKIPSWFDITSEDNVWYNDHAAGTSTDIKDMWGNLYVLKDSLPAIQWKIENEHRDIAGFNCKKAVGKIFDSVYIFAFYTDEITISGGPMNINGLPGMILGLTIPRMHTSWIATRVMVNNVDQAKIAAPSKGKVKNTTEVKKIIADQMKDEGDRDDWYFWRMFL